MCCWVPLGAALGLASPKLNVEVKNPNGKAPIPKDMWNPLSPPNPNPGKVEPGSGSERWPAGLGGTFSRGSCCLVLPLPYRGITFSLLIAALHTGHTWRLGLVSSHWWRHGQLESGVRGVGSANGCITKTSARTCWPRHLWRCRDKCCTRTYDHLFSRLLWLRHHLHRGVLPNGWHLHFLLCLKASLLDF